ncbi:MAG TPA: YceI family protein [Burkholderiales bacterium]|nr:YceI family protein [Burkholderiales bacterium]
MKKLLATALVAFVASPVFAVDEYTIDPNHTFPMFEVSHLGMSMQRGRFNKSSGKITLDRVAKQGSVELTIEVGSLDMGFNTWDQHMFAEGFFDVEKYPTITFKSNKLIFEGDKVVAAEGDFTLLGVTKPIRLTVSDFNCGTHPMLKKAMCGANVSTTIKRSEFGMKKALPAVGDEVKLFSPIEAFKKDPPIEP